MNKFSYVKKSRDEVAAIPEKHQDLVKTIMRAYTRFNVWVYKKTNGKLMKHFPGGYPICVVTMIGKKSGQAREIALIHLPWEEKKLLVASLGGMDKNPIWYYNIAANPKIEIMVEGIKKSYIAKQASAQEKENLWPHLLSLYPDFDEYQARTDRDIPVFICDPEN